MNTTMILVIVLLLILVGALPAWPHSREWGYSPVAIIVVLVILLLLLG